MAEPATSPVKWTTCCSETHPAFVKFIVQVIVGLLVIGFCMLMIAQNPDAGNQIYIGFMSWVVGVFFPHPSIKVDQLAPPVPASPMIPSTPASRSRAASVTTELEPAS